MLTQAQVLNQFQDAVDEGIRYLGNLLEDYPDQGINLLGFDPVIFGEYDDDAVNKIHDLPVFHFHGEDFIEQYYVYQIGLLRNNKISIVGYNMENNINLMTDIDDICRETIFEIIERIDEEEWYIDYIAYQLQESFSSDTHTVVTWPESQDVIGEPDARLITDNVGEHIFGGSAYLVPKSMVATEQEGEEGLFVNQ